MYDLVVIGGGSGGVRAARIASGLGARVALVEARDLGGTCVNLGCVPKKLLAYAARFGEHLQDARGFGWEVGPPPFDWAALIRAKDVEISRLNAAYQRLLESAGVEIVRGFGVVADRNTVIVGDRALATQRILIATGGTPWRPHVPGAELAWVSDDLFHLEALPARMAVVGGGYIAVEFASILAGLGVQTSLLYRGDLFLRGFDVELRKALAAELRKKGVDVRFETRFDGIEAVGDRRVVLSGHERIETDRVLLAVGRKPLCTGLGLEAIGVELTSDGVLIGPDFQSTVPGIYAIGDVADRGANNSLALTPVALAEGMILAHNLFGVGGRVMDYADVPTAVFSNPNFATVGLSEEHARVELATGRVYTSTFTPMVHTLSGRDEKTVMKLVVCGSTDKVVGAHMIGPDAGELIQGLAVAMRAGATKQDFDQTIGIHPTAAEEFVTLRSITRAW